MPLYEHVCDDCGARFEIRRSIADRDADTPCPECSAPDAPRVCSLFARAGAASPLAASPHGAPT